MMDITGIYSLILKDGLRNYKYKNSAHIDHPSEEQKGAIFGYRTKKNMTNSRGVVLTSLEAIIENADNFSHWTPNVYRYGTYAQKNPRVTKGHSEDNLRQINTFYVDFDVKDDKSLNSGDILVASLDLGFMPTIILKTDNGYQAYFVLSTPAYVTSKSEFQVIKVAKLISQNLRKYFNTALPVDLTCNHFGIARIPREDNTEFYDSDNVYSFNEWLQWSYKQDDLFISSKTPMLLLTGTEGKKQIDEPWYQLLKSAPSIKGTKDKMGRNNVMFTLALACYSSGVAQNYCEDELSEFNDTLKTPLKQSELLKIINSAYSGKYQAASRDFIILLCHLWIDETLTSKDLFIRQGWYKFKKKRSDRQRSHYAEWTSDVLSYIESKTDRTTPYIQLKKKEIIADLSIPERSLDYVLKDLKETNRIFYKFKAGRNGGITVALISTLISVMIEQNTQEVAIFLSNLAILFEEPKKVITTYLKAGIEVFFTSPDYLYEELDTG